MFSSIFSGYPPSALFSRDILKVLQMCITSLWCHLSSHNPDGFLVLSMDSESLSSQQLSLLSTSYMLCNGYILLQSLEGLFQVYASFGKFIKNEWLNSERSVSQISSFLLKYLLHDFALHIPHASHMAHSTCNPGLVQLLFHALQLCKCAT